MAGIICQTLLRGGADDGYGQTWDTAAAKETAARALVNSCAGALRGGGVHHYTTSRPVVVNMMLGDAWRCCDVVRAMPGVGGGGVHWYTISKQSGWTYSIDDCCSNNS